MAKEKKQSFFGEVSQIMKETKWPNGKEMRKYTSIVFVTIALFTLFFFVTDTGINWFLSLL